LRFIPHLPVHEAAEIRAASVLGAVITHSAQSAGGDKVRLQTLLAMSRAVLLSTVSAGRWGLTVCSHVVELLTPCALKRHGEPLIGFHSDPDIAQMGQL
jgi:hypothetical protein